MSNDIQKGPSSNSLSKEDYINCLLLEPLIEYYCEQPM
jgi:hypothetical protein